MCVSIHMNGEAMAKHKTQRQTATKITSVKYKKLKAAALRISATPAATPTGAADLMDQLEHSINAIAWGCDALVHTLYDGEPSRIDGAVWVADKIREEAFSLQDTYKQFIQQSHSMPTS